MCEYWELPFSFSSTGIKLSSLIFFEIPDPWMHIYTGFVYNKINNSVIKTGKISIT
jgi:hypothetical protein